MTSDIEVRDPWHEADEILSLRADVEILRNSRDESRAACTDLHDEIERTRRMAMSLNDDVMILERALKAADPLALSRIHEAAQREAIYGKDSE